MNITFTIISSIAVAYFSFRYLNRRKRRKEIKDWQINDVLLMCDTGYDNKKVAILLGWNLNSAIVRYEAIPNMKYEVNIWEVKTNKSAYWRRLKASCKDTMGVEPNFNSEVILDSQKATRNSSTGNSSTGGKPIELLTEIECQIYLKECLKNEDYETAELIRNQMEKYR